MEGYVSLLKTILLPLIGGVVIIWSVVSKFREVHRLLKKGEKTEGIIFDFNNDTKITWGDSTDSPTALHYPVIRFVTLKGEWITQQYYVTNTSMKQGDKVNVIYDPANPRDFYVHVGHTDTILYVLGMIAGIAAIGFGVYKLVEYLLN